MTAHLIAVLSEADYGVAATTGPQSLDTAALVAAAEACAGAGYDAVCLPHTSVTFEPMELAGYLAALNQSIGLFVMQRPGYIAPTMFSRMAATLDQLSGGRLSLIMDLDSTGMRADGDVMDDAGRLARALEYIKILKLLWAAEAPVDHQGRYYTFNKGRTLVRPLQQAALPVWLMGVAGQDLAAAENISGLVQTSAQLAQAQAAVSQASFSQAGSRACKSALTFDVVIAETKQLAWKDAQSYLGEAALKTAAVNTDSPDAIIITAEGRLVLAGTPNQVIATIAGYGRAGFVQFFMGAAAGHVHLTEKSPQFIAACQKAIQLKS